MLLLQVDNVDFLQEKLPDGIVALYPSASLDTISLNRTAEPTEMVEYKVNAAWKATVPETIRN